MALTALEYMVLTTLRRQRTIGPRPAVLEFGHSNWYGDVPLAEFESDLQRLTASLDRPAFLERFDRLKDEPVEPKLYGLARLFFDAILDAEPYVSIDPGSPGSDFAFDLNQPVPLTEQFDVTLNFGTAEHIFNVAAFFGSFHDRTKPGGLMVHSGPFTGWPDHGFYSFHPTLYFDLARANGYEILSIVCAQFRPLKYVQIADHDDVYKLVQAGQVPPHSHLNVVFRKTSDSPFKVPTQAYYAGALSPQSSRLWSTMR